MATKKTFEFKLGDKVQLILSKESGVVVGRAHYLDANPSYLVAFKAADGRQVQDWWNESLVVPEGQALV